ncbi:MAG: type II toxin-antitoxin system prevent-host-death family antitoxin [Vicinamibacterales bacterium]
MMAASKYVPVRRRQPRPNVGVRELRQNLSIYLDRVKTGETLRVTEHGHVVALLSPLPAAKLSQLEQMVAEGRATAPTRSLKDLPLPRTWPDGDPRPAEDIIGEMREDIV